MKNLKKHISIPVDNMSMEDFKQYVKNDMSDFYVIVANLK